MADRLWLGGFYLYEGLGMTIDWSKAPEWATHFGAETEKYNAAWYQLKGDTIVRWSSEDLVRSYNTGAPTGGFFPEMKDLVCRPDPWSGEGLPPVGAVCEIKRKPHGSWGEAIVRFRSSNVLVWDWSDEPAINGNCTAYAHQVECRLIRTHEQIAAEERDNAARELYEAMVPFEHRISWANHKFKDDFYRAIDAGYRKQAAE